MVVVPMVVLVTTWTALILDRLLAKEHGWQYIVTQFVIHVQVKFLAILVSAQRFLIFRDVFVEYSKNET